MEELLKVILVITSAALLLLGTGTLIQLVEQLIQNPGPGAQRH
ncbi:MAG TPA: hypothetical protein VFW08_12245 [bacterium]|nr:hypothetical protein [bacterium]